MRALVLDDSRAMRSTLTRTMDGLGLEVETTSDGAEGLGDKPRRLGQV